MIRSLHGMVTYHVPTGMILELAGVGYLVKVTLRALPAVGATVTLFTHHHIREQEQSLYGFLTFAELETFEALLEVPSIGPKSALAILSLATPEQISDALERENVSFFSSVPGIGKKSAAKIIVELRGKLAAPSSGAGSELEAALAALGYQAQDIQRLLRDLPDLPSTQARLSWALQQLGKR